MAVLKEHHRKNWRTNNNSKRLGYSFVDLNESRPIGNKIRAQDLNAQLGT